MTRRVWSEYMPREVTRHISVSVQCMLWGRAAGRCEFEGCNVPLWKSPVTQEQVNIAQKAHIYAFSDGGPRGNAEIDETEVNDIGNLMLVCHACHRKMDQSPDGGRYSADLLRDWKADHERRIDLVTEIKPDKRSHVVLYGANIGNHSSPLRFSYAATAMFPERYPAEDRAIELGLTNSVVRDCKRPYWELESNNLRAQFQRKIGDRLATGNIGHMSIFGLAPQPLLILLGSLLTDIPAADVYQLKREPPGWMWSNGEHECEFQIIEPANRGGTPALVFSLSATVTQDRIASVLGPNASIWQMTFARPHNDFLQGREQLRAFRQATRQLLNAIKAAHGQEARLHVFPAMPVAAAIELGRIHMPKADMNLRVYDEIRGKGFVPALEICSSSA
jgi:CBASS immunity sensor of nucleotide second messenger signals